MSEPSESLGPCCICEKTGEARNLLQLDQKCPMPGRGWGCVVCKLPLDGAMAVVCDKCLDLMETEKAELKFACKGRPGEDGRVPYTELQGEHKHDMAVHAKFESVPRIGVMDIAALTRVQFGLNLTGPIALQVLRAIQFACRHEGCPQEVFEIASQVGNYLQSEISVTPNLAAFAEAGWGDLRAVPVEEPRIIVPGGGR